MTWRVRRASLHDSSELKALCKASVGDDDYVIRHLEWELLHSVVHVALDRRDRIVGMTVYRPCIDGSGWLAMARTHPDVRRQGVNRALVESFVGMARVSGIPILRLWTNAGNEEGVATFGALGFQEVARFARIEAAAARGPQKAQPRPFDEDLWRRVEDSAIVAKGHRYVAHGWSFVPATRPVVFAIAAKGHVRSWDGNVLALPEPPEKMDPTALQFTVWAGDLAGVLAEACREANAAGRDRAGTYIPHDRGLLAEARRSGFEVVPWGDEAILCELAVPTANLRKRVRPTFGELAAVREGRGQAHQGDALGWARWSG